MIAVDDGDCTGNDAVQVRIFLTTIPESWSLEWPDPPHGATSGRPIWAGMVVSRNRARRLCFCGPSFSKLSEREVVS